MKTFFEVGRALLEIRDGKLYRDHYETFDAYCKEKWEFGKSQAYRLINAAETLLHISPIGEESTPVPSNEAQVRPLVGLQPEEAKAVWTNAVENAGDRPVTAKLVEKAAAEFKKPAEKPAAETTKAAASVAVPPVAQVTSVNAAPAVPPAPTTEAIVTAQTPVPDVKRSPHEVAFEAADGVVTYLRTCGETLTPPQMRDWGKLLMQVIELCGKLGIEASGT